VPQAVRAALQRTQKYTCRSVAMVN
jgi:hypothetical protein